MNIKHLLLDGTSASINALDAVRRFIHAVSVFSLVSYFYQVMSLGLAQLYLFRRPCLAPAGENITIEAYLNFRDPRILGLATS